MFRGKHDVDYVSKLVKKITLRVQKCLTSIEDEIKLND